MRALHTNSRCTGCHLHPSLGNAEASQLQEKRPFHSEDLDLGTLGNQVSPDYSIRCYELAVQTLEDLIGSISAFTILLAALCCVSVCAR